VGFEHGQAKFIYLALRCEPDAGVDEAKIDAADAREEGGEGWLHLVYLPQYAAQPPLQGRRFSKLALPDNHASPTEPPQLSEILSISCNISIQLAIPIVLVAAGPSPVFAGMPVPEASMHKNGEAMFWQNNIRIARKISPVQSKP
jgi:hypothetical protein